MKRRSFLRRLAVGCLAGPAVIEALDEYNNQWKPYRGPRDLASELREFRRLAETSATEVARQYFRGLAFALEEFV